MPSTNFFFLINFQPSSLSAAQNYSKTMKLFMPHFPRHLKKSSRLTGSNNSREFSISSKLHAIARQFMIVMWNVKTNHIKSVIVQILDCDPKKRGAVLCQTIVNQVQLRHLRNSNKITTVYGFCDSKSSTSSLNIFYAM